VWRTLAAVSTECDLTPADYHVEGYLVRVSSAKNAFPVPQQEDIRAVEVLLEMESFPDIKAAHAHAEAILTEFLDRVALCGYALTRLGRLISTCPLCVLPGEEFEMVIPDMHSGRSRVRVGPEDIDRFDAVPLRDDVQFARRCIRRALEAPLLEDRLLNDFIALERIADTETEETVKQDCPNCKEKFDTGRKATARYIRHLLIEDGTSARLAKDVVNFRGRIAHGAAPRSEAFLRELCRLVATVESTAVGVVAEHSGAIVRHPDQFIPVLPVTRYWCKRHQDGSFSILDFECNTAVSMASVKRAKETASAAAVFIGLSTDGDGALPIDPDAWPD
jgi:hypothetical protein